MLSNRIVLENITIEVFNNWIGVQSILINNKVVSKKFSMTGCEHQFKLMESGRIANYILTTRTSSKTQILKTNQVLIDLTRNGKKIQQNLLLNIGKTIEQSNNHSKAEGIKYLYEYEIDEAINSFKQGLVKDSSDGEIYFLLACCYSIEEDSIEGIRHLELAIKNNFLDIELILNHEMLAYVRMQEEFEKVRFEQLGNQDEEE